MCQHVLDFQLFWDEWVLDFRVADNTPHAPLGSKEEPSCRAVLPGRQAGWMAWTETLCGGTK